MRHLKESMSESKAPDDASVAPEEAFALLGNETRIAILHELWKATRSEGPLTFSDLKERVGVRDSGQFNYHLNKLNGVFVRKTDEGYLLRMAGIAVVGAIMAGTYERAGFEEPIPVEDPCPHCGGGLEMTYAEERATLRCGDCERSISTASVPPGVFEGYEREAYPEVFDRWLRTRVEAVDAGFCMACEGRVERSLVADPTLQISERQLAWDDVRVRYECTRCGDVVVSSVGEALMRAPEVIRFHHEHGVDLRSEPSWRLAWLHEPPTVVSTDPLEVTQRIAVDGDETTVTVDEDANVAAAEE